MLNLQQLTKKADRLWPEVLKSQINGTSIFPWTVSLGLPSSRDLMEKFEIVSAWLSELRQLAEKYHFDLTLTEVNHRHIGTQSLPTHLVVPDLDCYLTWRQKKSSFEKFRLNLETSLQAFPELQPWIFAKPLILDREGNIWPKIIKVLQAIKSKPWPKQYLRSFHVPDVDTKFIENHRQLLDTLLPQVLHPDQFHQDLSANSLRSFCEKYGFHYDYHLIRFRYLDLQICLTSLSDLSVPLPDFVKYEPRVETVFITENKANGLAFPDFPRAMVIFGLGGGIDSLRSVEWLKDKRIYYWGDLDSHGFAILARLREFLPQTRSILMDRVTLEFHRDAWGSEHTPKLSGFPWDLLTGDEQETFQLLQVAIPGQHLRLEQEHIGFPWLIENLNKLLS